MNNPTFPQWISVPGKAHAAACSLDSVVRSTLEHAKDPVTGTLKTETISPLEALRDSLYVQLRRAASKQFHGTYNMECLDCCARLVSSARPSRLHQEEMLELIARHKSGPSRESVLEALTGL